MQCCHMSHLCLRSNLGTVPTSKPVALRSTRCCVRRTFDTLCRATSESETQPDASTSSELSRKDTCTTWCKASAVCLAYYVVVFVGQSNTQNRSLNKEVCHDYCLGILCNSVDLFPLSLQVSKFARNTATTFAPRASGPSKNPAFQGAARLQPRTAYAPACSNICNAVTCWLTCFTGPCTSARRV